MDGKPQLHRALEAGSRDHIERFSAFHAEKRVGVTAGALRARMNAGAPEISLNGVSDPRLVETRAMPATA